MCWMTILAVLKMLSSDASENWWEVWSGDCVSSLCFALSQFVAIYRCERPLCGDTNTLAKAPRHTLQTLSKITESQSRRVCCTIRNIIFFFFPVCFACESRVQPAVNYCIQAGSEQAENQVSEGFSSLEFVLQQTFYPVVAKVKRSEFRRLKTQLLRTASLIMVSGVWIPKGLRKDLSFLSSASAAENPTECIRILQIYYSTGNHFCITDNYWCKKKKQNCALLQMGWSTLGKHDSLRTQCKWCSVHSLWPFEHQTLLVGSKRCLPRISSFTVSGPCRAYWTTVTPPG